MTNQDFPFFESIRLHDGVFQLLPLHNHRMEHTIFQHFGEKPATTLHAYLKRFDFPTKGLFKCRLAYGQSLGIPEFRSYTKKPVNSLKLVEANGLDYGYKRADRSALEALFAHRGDCDDVLIVVNGCITDSSYCNIVFGNKAGWFTPDTPLLRGVQRQHLLDIGLIREAIIRTDDLPNYNYFKLINAMIPWQEAASLPVSAILK